MINQQNVSDGNLVVEELQSTTNIEVGGYARLKGLTQATKFNGKVVKIVAFVEKKERWKVKLLHIEQEDKYLGVTSKNLNPIMKNT